MLVCQSLWSRHRNDNTQHWLCAPCITVKHAKMYVCKKICQNRIKKNESCMQKQSHMNCACNHIMNCSKLLPAFFLPPIKSNKEYIHQSRRTEHLAATGPIESLKNRNVLCRMYLLRNDSAHARCFAMQSTHQTSVTLRPHWVWSDMLRTQEPDSFNIEILSSFKCFKGTLL